MNLGGRGREEQWKYVGYIKRIKLLTVCSLGSGKSKKLAKRQAAYKMQQMLKDQPMESQAPQGLNEDEDDVSDDSVIDDASDTSVIDYASDTSVIDGISDTSVIGDVSDTSGID